MVKVKDAGISLTCRDCGRQFVFTEGEQEFYDRMGFMPPSRCQECRSVKEKQNGHFSCSKCGVKLPRGTPVYCESCLESSQPTQFICSQCGTAPGNGALLYCETCLKNVRLDAERKAEKYKKAASAAESKLGVAETQNEELQRQLYEAKQRIAELELTVNNLNQDLEKAYQFHVASGWLKPALDAITERLGFLEQVEQETSHRVATAVSKIQKLEENTSLRALVKRLIIPHRKQDRT